MDFLRNFFSSILILLTIPLLLVATLSFIAGRTIFSESYVKRQAEESQLYEGLAGFAAAGLKEQANDAALEPVIERSVTTERVRAAVEPALTSFFRYLRTSVDNVSIVVDLRPIKNDIQAQVPASRQEEVEELIPDELRAETSSQDQISPEPNRLERFKGWYRLATYLPVLVLVLLVLLAFINHGRSRIRRPAYVFLIAGLILGLVGGIVTLGIPYALERLVGNPDFPGVFNAALESLARSVGGEVARWILIFGVGYILLAIVLFVASFFMHQPVKVGGDERVYDPRRGSSRR